MFRVMRGKENTDDGEGLYMCANAYGKCCNRAESVPRRLENQRLPGDSGSELPEKCGGISEQEVEERTRLPERGSSRSGLAMYNCTDS